MSEFSLMCSGGFKSKAGKERGGGVGQGEAEREGSAAEVWLSELSAYSCGPETSSDSQDQN